MQAWLRRQCGEFVFRPEGVYVANGALESAALANVIEVALVDFILERIAVLPGAEGRRGEERSYPDLELSGEIFGGGFHAVDIKMARLAKNGTNTQSRCTLYTGNTYFKWPMIRWPGMFRSFEDYSSHVDIIRIYRLDLSYRGRSESSSCSSTSPGGSRRGIDRAPPGSTSAPCATLRPSGSAEAPSRPRRSSTGTGGPSPSVSRRPSSANWRRPWRRRLASEPEP